MKEEFQVITEKKAETAILVGIITQDQDERKTTEYLDELEFLADTAGVRVMRRFTQKIPQALAATYVGKGKLEEMRDYIKRMEDMENEVGMAIFDDELTAKQMSAIESVLGVKVLDRTSLILDIFAMRAQTAHAKTQVELAQYRYLLPRLQRMWTHLERQGGGSGAGGGKGRDGPPNNHQAYKLAQGAAGRYRPSEINHAQEPRPSDPRCIGRIHQRRQIHPYEPALQERCVCREQTLCNP